MLNYSVAELRINTLLSIFAINKPLDPLAIKSYIN